MNVKQTLVIIFFMMFCVAFVPRADAAGYYCNAAVEMYNDVADMYHDRHDRVDRLNNMIDNEGNTWADKKSIAEDILRHLKRMSYLVNNGSPGTFKESIEDIRDECPMSSELKRVIRRNREDSKTLKERTTYWKGTLYAIEKAIERQKEREAFWISAEQMNEEAANEY